MARDDPSYYWELWARLCLEIDVWELSIKSTPNRHDLDWWFQTSLHIILNLLNFFQDRNQDRPWKPFLSRLLLLGEVPLVSDLLRLGFLQFAGRPADVGEAATCPFSPLKKMAQRKIFLKYTFIWDQSDINVKLSYPWRQWQESYRSINSQFLNTCGH